MATNIQTLGDEAIYVPWPGYTGTPTPASGKTISGLTGKKELRTIKDSTGKVIWAHKWRLTVSYKNESGSSITDSTNYKFVFSSNDPKFDSGSSKCVGRNADGSMWARCKNGYTITVTCVISDSTGDVIYNWSDSSDSPDTRTFTMTSHLTRNVVVGAGVNVSLSTLSTAGMPFYSKGVKTNSYLDVSKLVVPQSVVDTITTGGFVPAYDSNTGILNLSKSGYAGWYLSRFVDRDTGESVPLVNGTKILVTKNMRVGCVWSKVISGKYLQTSRASNANVRFLFKLQDASNMLTIPQNGTLSIGEIYGLLTHEGGSQDHEMCISVSVSDITESVSDISNIEATGTAIDSDPTKWHARQPVNYPNKTRILVPYRTGSSTLTVVLEPNLPSASECGNDGKKWDIFTTKTSTPYRSGVILPFAPRVTPIPYEDWIKFIPPNTSANYDVADFSTDQDYASKHPDEYLSGWDTVPSLFTNMKFGGGDDTLDRHLILLSGGKFVKITNSSSNMKLSTVLSSGDDGTKATPTLYVAYSTNEAAVKYEVHIVPCCSVDVVTIINSHEAIAGSSISDYRDTVNSSGTSTDYIEICQYDTNNDEIVIATDTVFSFSGQYYARVYDSGYDKYLYYAIPVKNEAGSTNPDLIVPAYDGETVREYIDRVAGVTGQTVTPYYQRFDKNSGIFVQKSTGSTNHIIPIHYVQNDGGVTLTGRAVNQNVLTLVMYKTNGCPVKWQFFIYKLEITLS